MPGTQIENSGRAELVWGVLLHLVFRWNIQEASTGLWVCVPLRVAGERLQNLHSSGEMMGINVCL